MNDIVIVFGLIVNVFFFDFNFELLVFGGGNGINYLVIVFFIVIIVILIGLVGFCFLFCC